MLYKQALSIPDKECLFYPDESQSHSFATLTYKQLEEVTNHLACKFSNIIGQKSSDASPVVCLLANSNTNYLLTIYALLKLDVIVFLLSVRNSEAAILHLLDKTHTSYLFYSNDFLQITQTVRNHYESALHLYQMDDFSIKTLVQSGSSTFQSNIDKDELDKIRVIFHSSGSTSFPKPIPLTTRCLFGRFASFTLEMHGRFWTDEDVVLTQLPFFHGGGVAISIIQWYIGGALALPLTSTVPSSSIDLLKSIQHSQITKAYLVPLCLEELMPLLRQDNHRGFQVMKKLKFVLCTGAACSPDICKELIEHGVNLVQTVGATETGFLLISDYDMRDKNQGPRLRLLNARQSTLKFLPIEPESNIYELVILDTDPYLAPHLAENGCFALGDLFLEQPPNSGYYLVQGRKDDILVHTTGEKTNPLPIELTLRQHPIIDHAVVIGHRRLCCAALIQLNADEVVTYEPEEIKKKVWMAVQDANRNAPSHSHILPNLIKIIPIGARLPVTNKGNIIRRQVDIDYGSVINEMYDHFLYGSSRHSSNSTGDQLERRSTWTRNEICTYLKIRMSEILNKPREHFNNHSLSFYSLSLNSLTAVQLRNVLCQEFGELDHNILFEFSTIDTLTDELLRIINQQPSQIEDDSLHYKETEELIDKYVDMMRENTKNTQILSSENFSNEDDSIIPLKRTVLITGANGSLGSQILVQLIKKSEVNRIYCLVRGDNPADRLRRTFEMRKQDPTVLLDTNRVIILPMNLNDDYLGQTKAMYERLQQDVTDIVHTSWRMDFNMTIKDFDHECLRGLYRLLEFASNYSSSNPVHVHFISSVSSSGSGVIDKVREEPLPRQMGIARIQGYGQSKYAGEHICMAARTNWGVPVDIYRLGQISGDSQTGVWNTSEVISLLICAGGGEMGILPEDGRDVDWIPVNYAAASIVDILLCANKKILSTCDYVHHIFNPNIISWSALLECLKSVGLQFNVVSSREWLSRLLANPNNPAYALASFFKQVFGHDKKFQYSKYAIEKTLNRTVTLKNCPRIDQHLVQLYLNYWSSIGFLKHGYNPTNI